MESPGRSRTLPRFGSNGPVIPYSTVTTSPLKGQLAHMKKKNELLKSPKTKTPPSAPDPNASSNDDDAAGGNSSAQALETEHISEARRRCREAQHALSVAAKNVAERLGAGHPSVMKAKKDIKRLRKREHEIRWFEVVQWHESNIATALRAVENGADISLLEAATKIAHDSELGQGHRIVLHGKDQIKRLKKLANLEQYKKLESFHIKQLHEASENGHLGVLDDVIQAGADALGSAHPAVEAARKALKHHRHKKQRAQWEALVNEHNELMILACDSNDADRIETRIRATMHSELGKGHPIVHYGKDYLKQLFKTANRIRAEEERQECENLLSDAFTNAEQALMHLEAEVELEHRDAPRLHFDDDM